MNAIESIRILPVVVAAVAATHVGCGEMTPALADSADAPAGSEVGGEGDEEDDEEDDEESGGDGEDGEGGSEVGGAGGGDDGSGDAVSVEAFELSGLVVDDQSAPIEGAVVLFCGPEPPGGGCIFSTTEVDGTFSIIDDHVGTFKVQLVPGVDLLEQDYSPVTFQVTLEAGEVLDLESPIIFPKTGARVSVASGPQLEVDEMLALIVNAESFNMPFGNDAEPYVAAKLLARQVWEPLLLSGIPDEEEIVAVWALNTFDAYSKDVPIGFRIRNETFELAAGSEAAVYTVLHDMGVWERIDADVRVSDDASVIHSAPGKGFEYVTWLALTDGS